MRWRRSLAVLATAACCALATGTTMAGPAGAVPHPAQGSAAAAQGAAAGSADTVPPTGNWGGAHLIALDGRHVISDMAVQKMSCPTPGNCTAAGFYVESNAQQAFVVSEVNGQWGTATNIPGLIISNNGNKASITALSCPAPGDCAVGGFYTGAVVGTVPFVTDSVNGSWGLAHSFAPFNDTFPQTVGRVNSLACLSPGNCVAVLTVPLPELANNGALIDILAKPWIVTETQGSWNLGQGMATAAGQFSPLELTTVSCSTPGNCLAGGYFSDAQQPGATPSHGHTHALTAIESNGIWQPGTEVPDTVIGNPTIGFFPPDARVTSVSCPSSGDCTAGGFLNDNTPTPFFAAVLNGIFIERTAIRFPQDFAAFTARLTALSCGAPHDCGAVGTYINDNVPQNTNAWAASMLNGANRTFGQTVDAAPGLNAGQVEELTSISCPALGTCVAGGQYTAPAAASGNRHALIITESAGHWTGVQTVAENLNPGTNAEVNDVSCATAGECAAGGFVSNGTSTQAFVIDDSPATATTVSLPATKVAFGHEQAARITVKVTPRTGGNAAGTVTVKAGSATVCTVTLSGGAASCTLAATRLRPGSYKITASYGGDATYSGSASGSKALTVAAEPTSTTLTLSTTKIKLGHEQSERLTVAVKPAFSGTPAGRVTIKAGSAVICTITLVKGKGSCTLTASKLRPGTYPLTASYSGVSPYEGSASPRKALTVTR